MTRRQEVELNPGQDHIALCEALDLADFEAGSQVAGQKFYYLKNEAVRLELALVQYAMQTLLAEGFTPIITPDLARVEVLEGIGKTGVVGIIKGTLPGDRMIGLRADLDALAIHEQTGVPYASINDGKMHSCGHDGHTTMLLGAARYLAENRNFAGTLKRVGEGKWRRRDSEAILVARDRAVAGPTAPSEGLCLVRVEY